MTTDSALKNLLPELQFLIFNGSSVPILGRLRCVCKEFLLSILLKNLLETHKDHARIRFEKVVHTAKPFFPEKMRNHTRSDEINGLSDNIRDNGLVIYIAGKPLGKLLLIQIEENEKKVFWEINCFLPMLWTHFLLRHASHNLLLQKHFIKTIDPRMRMYVMDGYHGFISWQPHKNQLTESKYINYAEAETQLWAVFSIVHQWMPEDFFASIRQLRMPHIAP